MRADFPCQNVQVAGVFLGICGNGLQKSFDAFEIEDFSQVLSDY